MIILSLLVLVLVLVQVLVLVLVLVLVPVAYQPRGSLCSVGHMVEWLFEFQIHVKKEDRHAQK